MTEPRTDHAGLLLPEGSRLLHIGPHKTGTTSLQAALFSARPAMLEQGVRHVGRTRNPASAVGAVTGRSAPTSRDTPPNIEAVLVPPRVAAEMALGMLIASGAAHDDRAGGVWVEPIEVARVSTSQLLYVVVRRSGALIASGLGSVVGRVRRRSGE